jgi:hypothetical protein
MLIKGFHSRSQKWRPIGMTQQSSSEVIFPRPSRTRCFRMTDLIHVAVSWSTLYHSSFPTNCCESLSSSYSSSGSGMKASSSCSSGTRQRQVSRFTVQVERIDSSPVRWSSIKCGCRLTPAFRNELFIAAQVAVA